MKFPRSSHISVLTLFLMIPAYSMNEDDDSDNALIMHVNNNQNSPKTDDDDTKELALGIKARAAFAGSAPLLLFGVTAAPVIATTAGAIFLKDYIRDLLTKPLDSNILAQQTPTLITRSLKDYIRDLLTKPLDSNILAQQTPTLIARSVAMNLSTMPLTTPINLLIDSSIVSKGSSTKMLSYASWAAKTLCAYKISNAVNTRLTETHFIPQAPPAYNAQHALAQMAVGMATGYATNQAITRTYNLFMTNLDDNYTQKESLIKKIRERCEINDDEIKVFTSKIQLFNGRIQANLVPWKPSANPATRSINATYREQFYQYDSRTNTKEFDYSVSQKDSAIIVEELISFTKKRGYLRISRYETEATSWGYLWPFGLDQFRAAIEQLKKDVVENHVTVINIPLNKILERPSIAVPTTDDHTHQ